MRPTEQRHKIPGNRKENITAKSKPLFENVHIKIYHVHINFVNQVNNDKEIIYNLYVTEAF